MIGVSSFIDASILYGSDLETSRSIRTFKNGKLRRQLGSNGKSYLPNVKKATELCNVTLDSTVCYVTGNYRACKYKYLLLYIIYIYIIFILYYFIIILCA